MGLDMYLKGERYFWDRAEHPPGTPPVIAELYELGYWRKHPNLHGFIVQTFADGIDNCRRIPLDQDQLKEIMEAVDAGTLPHTTGFFFGLSDGTEMEDDLRILKGALNWLLAKEEGDTWRSVYYQASW